MKNATNMTDKQLIRNILLILYSGQYKTDKKKIVAICQLLGRAI